MPKKPLITTLPATAVRIHFGDALKRVHTGDEQVIIEKGGLRVAALLSYADFEQYQKLLALYQLEQLNRNINHRSKLCRGFMPR